MNNPYRMLDNWPHLGDIKPGSAIGIIPDGKGGTWIHHRSEPPIIHVDASGNILKSFGDGMFAQAHGFCQDKDGNFWAGDSGMALGGAAAAAASTAKVKGFTFQKFSPDGKLLMTLGKDGVSKAGPDTFISPTACAIAANGDIVIADGHVPRPPTRSRMATGSCSSRRMASSSRISASADRIRASSLGLMRWRLTPRAGCCRRPLEQPHSDLRQEHELRRRLAALRPAKRRVDSEGRYAPRVGLRIIVAGFRPPDLGPIKPGEPTPARNGGWQNGNPYREREGRVAEVFHFRDAPEGLAADELGNVFGGLTSGCETSPSGGCLQKFVKK